MQTRAHKNFVKNFKRRISPNPKLTSKFQIKLKHFIANPQSPILNDHKLVGKLGSYRAFSVTGDIRVVYRIVGDELWLYDIGTHNQVY